MYIQELKVKSFRHLRDATFGPFREPVNPSELIVLAGPNGGGKTSILELLSLALASRHGWNFWQQRTVANEQYVLKIGLTTDEIKDLVSSPQIPPEPQRAKLFDYLNSQRGYWIEAGLNEIPEADRSVNEAAHRLVSGMYSNFSRTLGFFIRSERAYQPRNYNTNSIFSRTRRLVRNHFNTFSYLSTTEQYHEIYDFLIEQGYDYTHKLGEYQKKLMRGEAAALPGDPIKPYDNLLGRILPEYSFVVTAHPWRPGDQGVTGVGDGSSAARMAARALRWARRPVATMEQMSA